MRPPEITSLLARVRGTLRSLAILYGAGRLLLLGAACVAGLFVLDYALSLPAGVRIVLLGVALVLVLTTAWDRLLRPATAPLPDAEIAARLEARHPDLHDRLLTAVSLSREGGLDPRESSDLARAAIEEAREVLPRLDPARALPGRRARHAAAIGALAAGLLLAAGGLRPELAGIFLRRVWGAEVSWPQRTTLVVLSPDARRSAVARGSRLRIEVRASGVVPSRGTLLTDFGTGGRSEPTRMAREGEDLFVHEIAAVPGDFTFEVEAGDARTGTYSVRALTAPQLDEVRLFLDFPEHTRMKDTPEGSPASDGNVVAPVGTKVRFEGRANKPLAEARLDGEAWVAQALALDPAGLSVAGRFEVAQDGNYTVRLVDRDGLRGQAPHRYSVRATPDRSPRVRPISPASDRSVTRLAVLPLAADVSDDFGVAEARAVFRLVKAAGAESLIGVLPLPVPHEPDGFGPASVRTEAPWDLGAVTVRDSPKDPPRPLRVGDVLELTLEALDHRPGSPNAGRSRPFTLSIVSPEDLERIIADALQRLRESVYVALDDQKRALRLAESAAAGPTDTERDRDAVNAQRQAARKAGDLAGELERRVEEVAVNRLGDPAYRAALEEMRDLARRAGRDRSARAVESLERARLASGEARRAGLAEARELQAGSVGDLEELLARMERWEKLADVLYALRRIHDDQEKARNDLLNYLREKLGGGGK